MSSCRSLISTTKGEEWRFASGLERMMTFVLFGGEIHRNAVLFLFWWFVRFVTCKMGFVDGFVVKGFLF